MKKFNLYILIALFIGFTACENDEERLYVNPIDQVAGPILTLDGISEIEVNESNVDMVPAILNWTRSDFGEDVLVEYTLELSSAEDFEEVQAITIGNNVYSKVLTAKTLSDWAINYFDGLDENGAGVQVSFFLRVVATIALENPTVTNPPGKLYSNSTQFTVLPYFVPPAFPSEMYMIGDEFGGWSWDSEAVVTLVPVHSFEGHFWAIRYIEAGKGFKWCAQRAWNGDFFSLGEDLGYYTEDGNAFVEESGLYMIYMDMENGKISVEPAKVFGMGDCFGGWNMGEYPFAIEDRTMTFTTTGTGELRMYANSDIAPIGGDWWKMEFIFFDGKIAYRGTGNDQERVVVDEGKKVVLDFNNESATVE
ncbi:SusF/SusE family outer membrane protein [Bacteroidales bacterium OttesenSCG-928-L03]|nr:SusF/SusE family outer membrane protein [Bacteroidales bacterium OttesenSCG-928-L03]